MITKHYRMTAIFPLLLCILLFSSFILSAGTSVSASSEGKKKQLIYIALGDSIATGYGLKDYEPGKIPKNSYTALIQKELVRKYGDKKQISYYNWAKDGRDSINLLKQLNELSNEQKKLLSQANIITVSIGSNDLLLPFIDILKKTFRTEISADSGKEWLLFFDSIKKLQTDLIHNEILLTACEEWSRENGTFHQILQRLKELAPQASIYVDTIFNPFDEVKLSYQYFGKNIQLFNLGKIADSYISKMNSVFSKDSEDYILISLEKEFKAPGLTNINTDWLHKDKVNLDPHPNALGHSVIAECVLRKMKIIS